MVAVEKDIAILRATCATKEDVKLILEKIANLSIEAQKDRAALSDEMHKDHIKLAEAIHKSHTGLSDDIHKLEAEMHGSQAEMYKSQRELYKHQSVLAWRVYAVIAVAMSAAFFIARYVH